MSSVSCHHCQNVLQIQVAVSELQLLLITALVINLFQFRFHLYAQGELGG